MRRMLNINDVEVTGKPTIYTCYGLGSCIGLFVTDRLLKLSGGAHIPLPAYNEGGNFMDALTLIDRMLQFFQFLGSDLNCLRAKIVGGAQVYESSFSIGEQNVMIITQYLVNRRIFIAATDVGGRISRTARYNTQTGDLIISTSDQKQYCI